MRYQLVGKIIGVSDKGYAYFYCDRDRLEQARVLFVYKTNYAEGDQVLISSESGYSSRLLNDGAKIICNIHSDEEWECRYIEVIRDGEVKLA